MGCCVSKEKGGVELSTPASSSTPQNNNEKGKEPVISTESVDVEIKEDKKEPAKPAQPVQPAQPAQPEETPEQKEEKLKKIFQQVDKDNSGFVDISELKVLLDRLKLKVDHESVLFILSRYDDDKNGRLNFEEFSEMVLSIMEVKKQFEAADIDKSGSISNEEMRSLMATWDFTPEISKEIFALFDENSSGEVDYSEFFALSFYLNELEYQYQIYKDRTGEDFNWLKPMLGPENAHKAEIVGKELLELKKIKPFPSISNFSAPIVRAAASGANNPLGGPKKVPLIKTQRARVRPPPRKLMKIQQSEAKLFVNTGTPYIDDSFPPSADILPASARAKVASWKRMSEINPYAKLFVDGVDEGDVIQGSLGDCWFLGALAVVATSTENFIEHLFVQQIPEIGYYQCRFFKNGKWVLVDIDDRLPCDDRSGLVFSRCKDSTEFWVPLVEKAYAKLHGSYHALESGSIADALKDLTGEGIEVMHIDNDDMKKNPSLAWNILAHNSNESFLMGCAIDAPETKQETELKCGLLTGHAYSIINCVEMNGNKLIRMRNPWGQGEWNGAWADFSKEWTPELLQKVNYEFANDGTFFISFPDFFKFYSRVYVLRLLTDATGEVWSKAAFEGHWKGETAAGCANHANWLSNPQYSMQVTTPNTKLFVNLSQPDLRYVLKQSPAVFNKEYDAIGLYIIKTKDVEYRRVAAPPEDRIATSTFTTVRDLSFEATVEPGNYLLVPCSFHPGVELQYGLSIYSSKPVTVAELTKFVPSKSLESEWRGPTAGGCANNRETWMNNPQFLLKCSTPGDVEILVTQEQIKKKELEAVGIYVFGSATAARATDSALLHLKPSSIINLPTVTETLKVEANANYIIMPTTFEKNLERKFTITVTSATASLSEFRAL